LAANSLKSPELLREPLSRHPMLPADGAKLRGSRRNERAVELCECTIDIAAALFNVPSKELRRPGRSAGPISRVRQVAMYVAHVGLSLKMNDVGLGFGRDRTTVLHACHLVEDLRDDEEFDRIVQMTERVVRAALLHRAEA